MTAVSSISGHDVAAAVGHPHVRWLVGALAFPAAGYVAWLLAGPVDNAWSSEIAGLVAGIGVVQWALLERWNSGRVACGGIGMGWITGTAVGMAAGLSAGAALVSYDTDIASLAVMGAMSGLGVGIGQGRQLATVGRSVGWTLLTAALWGIGWAAPTSIGVPVDDQWPVFGTSGAALVLLVQSTVVPFFTSPAPRP